MGYFGAYVMMSLVAGLLLLGLVALVTRELGIARNAFLAAGLLTVAASLSLMAFSG